MAQLYFTAGDYEKILSLQEEIRRKQAQLSAEAPTLDTKGVKELAGEITALQKSLESAAKSAAALAMGLQGPSPEAMAKSFGQVLDIYKKYLDDRQAIGSKYDQQIDEADPEQRPGLERKRDKELARNDTKLTASLGKLEYPDLDALIGDMKTWIGEQRAKILGTDAAATEAPAGGIPVATEAPAPEVPSELPAPGSAATGDIKLDIGAEEQLKSLDAFDQSLDAVKLKLKEVNKAKPDELANAFTALDKNFTAVKTNISALGAALGDCSDGFVETATQIFSFYQGLVGGIGSVVTGISKGMDLATKSAAGAMTAMETASVVLMVISGVMQVATAIAGLFNNDKAYEKIQKQSKMLESHFKFLEENQAAVKINEQVNVVTTLAKAYDDYVAAAVKSGNIMALFAPGVEVLRDNHKVVNDLIQSYTNLGYSVTQSLGEEKYSSARKQLESMVAQQRELYIQMDAEQNKKKSDDNAVQEYQQNIQKLGAEIMKLLAQMTEEIMGGSAAEISQKLGGAFIDAFAAGTDAAYAWKAKVDELVADIVRRMIITKVVEPKIGGVFDEYEKKWFGEGDKFGSLDNILDSMPELSEDLKGASKELEEFFAKLKEQNSPLLGYLSGASMAGSTSRGFETISQETAGELSGRFADLQATGRGALSLSTQLSAQAGALLVGQEAVRSIADDARNLTLQSYLQLVQISANTGAVVRPIRNMAEKIESILSCIKEL